MTTERDLILEHIRTLIKRHEDKLDYSTPCEFTIKESMTLARLDALTTLHHDIVYNTHKENK